MVVDDLDAGVVFCSVISYAPHRLSFHCDRSGQHGRDSRRFGGRVRTTVRHDISVAVASPHDQGGASLPQGLDEPAPVSADRVAAIRTEAVERAPTNAI